MQKSRTENLQIGLTKIGEDRGIYEGERVVLSIYYGNLALPPVHGKLVHSPVQKYEQMLFDFLNSPEGEDYIFPSDAEKYKAMNLIINSEEAILESISKNRRVVIPAQEAESQKEPASLVEQTEEKPETQEPDIIPVLPMRSVYKGMNQLFSDIEEEDRQEQNKNKISEETQQLIDKIASLDHSSEQDEPEPAIPAKVVTEPAVKPVVPEKNKPVQKEKTPTEKSSADSNVEKKIKAQSIIIAIQFVLICIMALLLLRG